MASSSSTSPQNAKVLASSLVEGLGATLSETRYQAVLAELTVSTQQKVLSFALEAAVARDEEQLAESTVNAFPQIVSGEDASASLYVVHDSSEEQDDDEVQEDEEDDVASEDREDDKGSVYGAKQHSVFSQEAEGAFVIKHSALGEFSYRRLSNSHLNTSPFQRRLSQSYQQTDRKGPLTSSDLETRTPKPRKTSQSRIPIEPGNLLYHYAHSTRTHVLTSSLELAQYLEATGQMVHSSRIASILLIPCKTYYGRGLGWIEVQIGLVYGDNDAAENKHSPDSEALTDIDVAVSKMMGTYLAAGIERLRSHGKANQKLQAKSSEAHQLRRSLKLTGQQKNTLENLNYMRAKAFEFALQCKAKVENDKDVCVDGTWTLKALAQFLRELSSDNGNDELPQFYYNLLCFGSDPTKWGTEPTKRKVPSCSSSNGLVAWVPYGDSEAAHHEVAQVSQNKADSLAAALAASNEPLWLNPDWRSDYRYQSSVDSSFLSSEIPSESRLCLYPIKDACGNTIAGISAAVSVPTVDDTRIDLNCTEIEDSIMEHCIMAELILQWVCSVLYETYKYHSDIEVMATAAAASLHCKNDNLEPAGSNSLVVSEWMAPNYERLDGSKTYQEFPEGCLFQSNSLLWNHLLSNIAEECFKSLVSSLPFVENGGISLLASSGDSTRLLTQWGNRKMDDIVDSVAFPKRGSVSLYKQKGYTVFRALQNPLLNADNIRWKQVTSEAPLVSVLGDEHLASVVALVPLEEVLLKDDFSKGNEELYLALLIEDTFTADDGHCIDKILTTVPPSLASNARRRINELFTSVVARNVQHPRIVSSDNSVERVGERQAILHGYSTNSLGAAVYMADHSFGTLHKTFSIVSDGEVSLTSLLPPEVTTSDSDVFQVYNRGQVRCDIVETLYSHSVAVLRTVLPLFVPINVNPTSSGSVDIGQVELCGSLVTFEKCRLNDPRYELRRRQLLRERIASLSEDCCQCEGTGKLASTESDIGPYVGETAYGVTSSPSVHFADTDVENNVSNVIANDADEEEAFSPTRSVRSRQSEFSPSRTERSRTMASPQSTVRELRNTPDETGASSFLSRVCLSIGTDLTMWIKKVGSGWYVVARQIHPSATEPLKGAYSRIYPGRTFQDSGSCLQTLARGIEVTTGSSVYFSDLLSVYRGDDDFPVNNFLILPVDNQHSQLVVAVNKGKEYSGEDSDEPEFSETDQKTILDLLSPVARDLAFKHTREQVQTSRSSKISRLAGLQSQYGREGGAESQLQTQALTYRQGLEYCCILQYLSSKEDIDRFVRGDLAHLLQADGCTYISRDMQVFDDGGCIANAILGNKVIQFHTDKHYQTLSMQDVEALQSVYSSADTSRRWNRSTNVIVIPVTHSASSLPAESRDYGVILVIRNGDRSKRFSAAEMNVSSSLGAQLFAIARREEAKSAEHSAAQVFEDHLQKRLSQGRQQLQEAHRTRSTWKEMYFRLSEFASTLRSIALVPTLMQPLDSDSLWYRVAQKLKAEITDENRERVGQITGGFGVVNSYLQQATEGSVSLEALYLLPHLEGSTDLDSVCEIRRVDSAVDQCTCRWTSSKNSVDTERAELAAVRQERQSSTERGTDSVSEILYLPFSVVESNERNFASLVLKLRQAVEMSTETQEKSIWDVCSQTAVTTLRTIVQDCALLALAELNAESEQAIQELNSTLRDKEYEIYSTGSNLNHYEKVVEAASPLLSISASAASADVLGDHLKTLCEAERVVVLFPRVNENDKLTDEWYSPVDETFLYKEDQGVIGKFLKNAYSSENDSLFCAFSRVDSVPQNADFDSTQDRLADHLVSLDMYAISSELVSNSSAPIAALVLVNSKKDLMDSGDPIQFLLRLAGYTLKHVAEISLLWQAVEMHHREDQALRRFMKLNLLEDSNLCPLRASTDSKEQQDTPFAEELMRQEVPVDFRKVVENFETFIEASNVTILCPLGLAYAFIDGLHCGFASRGVKARDQYTRKDIFIPVHSLVTSLRRISKEIAEKLETSTRVDCRGDFSLPDLYSELEEASWSLDKGDPALAALESLELRCSAVQTQSSVIAACPIGVTLFTQPFSARNPSGHFILRVCRTARSDRTRSPNAPFSTTDKHVMLHTAASLSQPISSVLLSFSASCAGSLENALSASLEEKQEAAKELESQLGRFRQSAQVRSSFMELVTKWISVFLRNLRDVSAVSSFSDEESLEKTLGAAQEEIGVARNEFCRSCTSAAHQFGRSLIGADSALLWVRSDEDGSTMWVPWVDKREQHHMHAGESSLVQSCSESGVVMTSQNIYKDPRFHAKESHLLRTLIEEVTGEEGLGSIVCIPLTTRHSGTTSAILQCCWSASLSSDELSVVARHAGSEFSPYKESLVLPLVGDDILRQILRTIREKFETEGELGNTRHSIEELEQELSQYTNLQETVTKSSKQITDLHNRIELLDVTLEKYERVVGMLTGLLAAEGHEQALYQPLEPRPDSSLSTIDRGRPLEWVCHSLCDVVGAESVRILLYWNYSGEDADGRHSAVLVPVTTAVPRHAQRPHLDVDDYEEFALQTMIYDILGIRKSTRLNVEEIFARALPVPQEGPITNSLSGNCCVNVDPLYVADSQRSQSQKHLDPVVVAPIRMDGERGGVASYSNAEVTRSSRQSIVNQSARNFETMIPSLPSGVFGVIEVVGKRMPHEVTSEDAEESFSQQDARFVCAAADGISRYMEYYLASEAAQWYHEISEETQEELDRQREVAGSTSQALDKANESIEDLEQKLRNAEEVEKEKNSLEQKTQEQSKQLEKLDKSNKKLEKRLEDLKDASMKASYHDKEKINELQQNLDSANGEIERLRSEHDSLVNKKDSLKRQRADLKHVLGLERDRLREQERRANDAEDGLADTRKQLEELQNENGDQREAINRLQRSLDSYEKALNSALEEKRSLSDKVEQHRKDWLESDQESRRLRDKLNDVANQLQRREKELQRAHDLIASLREELSAADKMAAKAWRVPV
eukprot:gb/GECG01011396.1/.p1 GENE.gb/GECG01011396.1/~~gb/GECG01011396.1/.p1  ORF type:complete len:2985 (+),score=416.49 gb/GECG01011396.1/:1-8955(+)